MSKCLTLSSSKSTDLMKYRTLSWLFTEKAAGWPSHRLQSPVKSSLENWECCVISSVQNKQAASTANALQLQLTFSTSTLFTHCWWEEFASLPQAGNEHGVLDSTQGKYHCHNHDRFCKNQQRRYGSCRCEIHIEHGYKYCNRYKKWILMELNLKWCVLKI